MAAGAPATPAVAGDRPGAVRCAFWLVFRLLNAGDLSSASGWIARIERVLSATRRTTHLSMAHLDVPDGAPRRLHRGSDRGRRPTSADRSEMAETVRRDWICRPSPGWRWVVCSSSAATSPVESACSTRRWSRSTPGETSPVVVGDSYCTAIDACHDVVDVRRGQTWTAAFEALVRYPTGPRAVCRTLSGASRGVPAAEGRVGRSHGPWRALPAGDCRHRWSSSALGAAIYQQGELHRLRGQFDGGGAVLSRGQRPRKGSAAGARTAPARAGAR